jgi:inner membrane protein involved in colicin E2 resistance
LKDSQIVKAVTVNFVLQSNFEEETIMSSFTQPMPSTISLRSRSLGAKFFVIMLLACLMSLSGILVEGLTTERANNHGLLAASSDNPSTQPTTVLGIHLADSYRSTRRSLHYITLFLGLVFLTYFLFEVSTGKRVHPAQYALVGVAQTIFYLLLLSFAEHLGFDLSFLIAGAATVALLSVNTEWVFRSRKLGLRALGVFTMLYAFIYVLLRVEAYALLVGAVTSFAAVAAAMYITRNVDWYGNSTSAQSLAAAPSGGASQAGVRESWLK